MPIGVITNAVSDKLPLDSLPPDGYVIVRRMNYGEKLIRSNMAAKFLMSSPTKDSKDFQGQLDMQTEEVAYWDFAHLVVEHNVQDLDGRTLNFQNRNDVRKLDGAVGEEIGRKIDEFQNPEVTQEVKNS